MSLNRETARAAAIAAMLMLISPQAIAQAQQADTDPIALEQGRALYFSGDFAAARALWEPLADAGNARALYNMATLYREGQAVPRDPDRARDLLRAAADAGFADAQYLLASYLYDEAGENEAQRQSAVRLWMAAAAQGHAFSRYRLGLLFWNGEAVARDLVRGHAWMALAAEDGLEQAAQALVVMKDHLTAEELRAATGLRAALAESPEAATPAQTGEPASRSGPARSAALSDATSTKAREAGQQTAGSPVSGTQAFSESWRLQIAAFRSPEDAEAEWSRLERRAADLVAGLSHAVVRADLGERGIYHRLQIGPFESRAAADSRCQALKAAGHGCFLLAPAAP